MGLITKEVEVGLGGSNLRHFESLGYKIPRVKKHGRWCVPRGTMIVVKVEDLPKGSKAIVKLKCDKCGETTSTSYESYTEHNHDGFTYCKMCAISIFETKENHWKWNYNLTEEKRKGSRCYPEYIDFVKRVMARDNYTCQCCGKSHNDIEVHHFDSYDWCVEKRTDDTNGITLCHSCHYNYHKLYGFGKNTKKQFEEWFGKAIHDLKRYNGQLPTARKIYCIEENKIYNSSVELIKEWGMASKSQVHNVCNHKVHCHTILGKHLLWLDEYETMTNEDIKKFLYKNKRYNEKSVICIDTMKIYDSFIKASEETGINDSGIKCCCLGTAKSAGKSPEGMPLRWMYYDEFNSLPNDEKVKIINSKIEYSDRKKTVICINTHEIFSCATDGAKCYGLKSKNGIQNCCLGSYKSSGKLPDGTPLRWMYYEDYLNLSNKEKQELKDKYGIKTKESEVA